MVLNLASLMDFAFKVCKSIPFKLEIFNGSRFMLLLFFLLVSKPNKAKPLNLFPSS